MLSVFEFTDYRAFLNAYYQERKRANGGFSYQCLARQAGLGNKGYLHNVLSGQRTLSRTAAEKLARVVAPSSAESAYFEILVAFNHARTQRERERLLGQMNGIRSNRSDVRRIRELRRDQHDFYAQWYHTVVWSLLGMYRFRDDYRWLAAKVRPAIGVRQARQSVALLERLGLVSRTAAGYCRTTDTLVKPSAEVSRVALHQLHLANAELGKRAIDDFAPATRDVTALTLGVSEKGYARIREEVSALRARLLAIVAEDKGSTDVYQCNFQVFPVSDTKRKGKLI